MSYTSDDLTRLKKALANGTTEVSYGGKLVKFRSIRDLKDAIYEVEKDLGTNPKILRRTVITGKGL